MTRERHYVNLTNGLEDLADLLVTPATWSFSRLRRTTIEREKWDAFLGEVPDDMIMHLALGWRCVVHDRGTLRPLSKTLFFGVPLIRYALDRTWTGVVPEQVPLVGPRRGPAPDGAARFDAVYRGLRHDTLGRVRYYARYWTGGPADLVGAGSATEHDGDVAYYAHLARSLLVG